MKTRSVMHKSKLGMRTWGHAIYMMNTSLKGVSSMKLPRDLGVTQKSAWFLAHRIREAMADTALHDALFQGPVEIDETYMGGLNKNRHESKKKSGRSVAGKEPVAGILDRQSRQIRAEAVYDTAKIELEGFIEENVAPKAKVFTDDHVSYEDLTNPHEIVQHSVKEYVRGMSHTNGVESFWAILKRGYEGIYHWLSVKHLDRYVQEFACRHNLRLLDTIVQLRRIAAAMVNHRPIHRVDRKDNLVTNPSASQADY